MFIFTYIFLEETGEKICPISQKLLSLPEKRASWIEKVYCVSGGKMAQQSEVFGALVQG